MKDFKKEIEFFYNKILNNEKFALGKFADGEWGAIKGTQFLPANGEWAANGNHPAYEIARKELSDALKYKHPDYYVAICPCYKETIEYSGQSETNITYANIFVNSNYEFYKKNYINLYKERDVHLVTHKDTNLDNLPFKVEKFYPIEYNAWILNRDLPDIILDQNPKDKLFLFAAGSFANILSHKLWDKNKDNIYLDVGSTLNPWTRIERLQRDYYMGNEELEKLVCPCPNYQP
jgi:hypothetical protein